MSDDVILAVAGAKVAGWTDVSIRRGAESYPNSFDIALTWQDPESDGPTIARAGDACTVSIGGDKIITGWIDRDVPEGGPDGRSIRIVGRGKCQDLVDCSAEWPNSQIKDSDALQIATKLAAAYGLTVKLGEGAQAGPVVPQFNLSYGETSASIIERISRFAKLLPFEDVDGNLVLAQIGKVTAASGAAYGTNIQNFAVINAVDERYSEIVCELQALSFLTNLEGVSGDPNAVATITDTDIKRHRRLYLVAEENAAEPAVLVKQKAEWEKNRRAARGAQVRVTVDSWRDTAGTLWTPNTLVPIDVPGLRLADKTMVLSEVTYVRNDERGTVADLYLLPPAAFTPEPIQISQVNTRDLVRDDGTVIAQ